MKNFFYILITNLVRIFSGRNLLAHILAMALTYIIVVSGFDWDYFQASRSVSFPWTWGPAAVLGGILPILAPITLLMIAKVKQNHKFLSTGAALTQAVMLGSFVSSLYKAFTGRLQPDLVNTTTDISNTFRFGFWEGGIFWGWPSSHTTIAFAMAVTLLILYPQSKKIKYLGLFYALYIGLGISISIHWFSEFIAGMIIGIVVGTVVGKSFKKPI